ncbi:MAG: metallophosphoesterase family protein [Pseudobacteriovorax sp.]|nr:metallophosphoesterase family protein [Pseudobacteriovorax sp.]
MESPNYENSIAIISCIHGNIEALEAVYSDILSKDIKKIICLGDLVGYGPYPNEVVSFIERYDIATVLGCWDEGIAQNKISCGCEYVSKEEAKLGEMAFHWTKSEVTSDTVAFLDRLRYGVRHTFACGKTLFVHGSPQSTSEYLTESTHEFILFERAARGGCDILVCGHTHVPFVKEISGTLNVRTPLGGPEVKDVELAPKLIINAGSVGEPRHGGVESTYVTMDTDTRKVDIHYVPYDLKQTMRAMRKKGIPEVLIERLQSGMELTGKDKSINCDC